MDTKGETKAFYEYFSEYDQVSFSAYGEYFVGDPPKSSIFDVLLIDKDNLKPFTKQISVLEEEKPSHYKHFVEHLEELTRGVRAYIECQDILDVSVDTESPLVNRHYCFFESTVFLRESVVSWLEGNVLAGFTLLRPFMELSLFHLYWKTYCEKNTYKPYYDWLDGKTDKPKFKNMVNYLFSNIPVKDYLNERRVERLKQVILNCYKHFCSYNHTPTLKESLSLESGGLGTQAYTNFFYYLSSAIILLHQLIYLYIVNYPMLLFPVEIHRKLGFQGPVGILSDSCNFKILESFLGSETMAKLKASLDKLPTVMSTLKWFSEHNDLTDSQLEESWQRFRQSSKLERDVDRLEERLAMFKAHHRSVKWALNYVPTQISYNYRLIPDEVVDKAMDYIKKW